jgi:hypothetical protein
MRKTGKGRKPFWAQYQKSNVLDLNFQLQLRLILENAVLEDSAFIAKFLYKTVIELAFLKLNDGLFLSLLNVSETVFW